MRGLVELHPGRKISNHPAKNCIRGSRIRLQLRVRLLTSQPSGTHRKIRATPMITVSGISIFISEDPIGFAGGDLNLYAYVGGSPLMRVDPSGLKCGSGWSDWVVPDSWWGLFSFESACDKHDKCYDRCGSTKCQCDNDFKNNLLSACKGLTGTAKTHCESMATSYYTAVKNLGQSAYDDAHKCCK